MTLGQYLLDQEADYSQVASSSYDNCPTEDPELLIDSTSPEESLILKKVQGTQSCGEAMPPSGSSLPQSDIDCLRDWIDGVIVDGPAQ